MHEKIHVFVNFVIYSSVTNALREQCICIILCSA